MKKIILGLVAVVGVITLLVFVNQPETEERRIIRMGYNAGSVNHATIMIAAEKGFFQEENVEVELIATQGSREIRQGFAAGQLDMGAGGISNFLSPIEEGAPIRMIAPLNLGFSYVMIPPGSELHAVQDLIGKRVIVGTGGVSDVSFRMMMKEENISPDDIVPVELEQEYRLQAFFEQKVADTIIISERETAEYLSLGAKILPEWQEKGYDKAEILRTVLFANTDFLDNHPDRAQSFLAALAKAHAFLKDSPVEASVILADHLRRQSGGAIDDTPEQALQAYQELANVIWVDPEVTEQAIEASKDIGEVTDALTLDHVYNAAFEPQLQKAHAEVYGQD